MDLAKVIPALQEPLTQRIFALFNERQRRAVELAEPYAVGSATGAIRSSNEDVGLVARWRFGRSPDQDIDLAIVCDGMGGMQHGRFAAQLAASVFVGTFLRQSRTIVLKRRSERALMAAQEAVYQHLRGDGGTTLSAVCIEGTRACVAHVGDSRVYALHENGALEQLTRDDTLGAALKRGDADHGDFNRLIQHIGMQQGGDDGALEPQIMDVESTLTRRGFVLTSDGAHGAGRDFLQRMSNHVRSGSDLVRKLLNVADALGGLDNATAVFLPERPTRVTSEGPGVSLSLLSATGEAQIWFAPDFSNEERRELVDPSRRSIVEERGAAPIAPPVERRMFHQSAEPPKSKGKTKRKRAPKKDVGDDPGLPLDEAPPQLQVHFPEDGE